MTTNLRVYFIRHGATEWTVSGQYTGGTDVPLSAQGEEEARKLAPRLREISFARVLTSSLQRARRTCELAGLAAAAEIDLDLTEWNNGEYEGHTLTDILGLQADWNLFRDGGVRRARHRGKFPTGWTVSFPVSKRWKEISPFSRTDISDACWVPVGSDCRLRKGSIFCSIPHR